MSRSSCIVAAFSLLISTLHPASAQERGFLAIDHGNALHAFSLSGEADAVNMCGTTGCEVVATFSACLGVAYSSDTSQDRPVWTWTEAATAATARVGAFDECTASGGIACEVLNVVCLDRSENESAPDVDRSTGELTHERLQALLRAVSPDLEPEEASPSAARSESEPVSEPNTGLRTRLRRLATRLNQDRTAVSPVDPAAPPNMQRQPPAPEAANDTPTREPRQRFGPGDGGPETTRPPQRRQRAPAAPGDCTKPRLMRLGVLNSSISASTTEFTDSRMVVVQSTGGASLRTESEYSVTARAITYRIVRAVGTAPGFGTRDVPIPNPGPHTEACLLSGAVLTLGDGTWR